MSHHRPQVASIVAAVDYFRAIAAAQLDQPDVERLIDGYLDLRGELSRHFQHLANSALDLDLGALDDVIAQVGDQLVLRYGDAVDEPDLTRVRGYGGVRKVLFAYLLIHEGEPVGASRLRVLTGDQVHTERRVRELRDLGLSIPSQRIAGEDSYRLQMSEFNAAAGARNVIRLNLRQARLSTGVLERISAAIERIDATG